MPKRYVHRVNTKSETTYFSLFVYARIKYILYHELNTFQSVRELSVIARFQLTDDRGWQSERGLKES